jgi:hypothetical protein
VAQVAMAPSAAWEATLRQSPRPWFTKSFTHHDPSSA